MPFVLIQFLPTRPSLGLQEFSDRQGETALRFRLRLTGLKRSAPSCKHGSHPFSNPAPCLPQVLDSPRSQLAVGNCMHSKWHLYIGNLFHLYKNPVYAGKVADYGHKWLLCRGISNRELRYPRRASHNTVDVLEIERAFCHNLIDEVRQRFAAYYFNRKTQQERSATIEGRDGRIRMCLTSWSV